MPLVALYGACPGDPTSTLSPGLLSLTSASGPATDGTNSTMVLLDAPSPKCLPISDDSRSRAQEERSYPVPQMMTS